MKSSPEVDPALGRVRPTARLPVTCLTGAQTELSSNYILITPGEKTRGLGNFWKIILGAGNREDFQQCPVRKLHSVVRPPSPQPSPPEAGGEGVGSVAGLR